MDKKKQPQGLLKIRIRLLANPCGASASADETAKHLPTYHTATDMGTGTTSPTMLDIDGIELG